MYSYSGKVVFCFNSLFAGPILVNLKLFCFHNSRCCVIQRCDIHVLQKSTKKMPTMNVDICLRVIDILWSCFVVTPLVVFYWSGTWKLLDAYVLPVSATDGVPLLSSYVSLGIGTAIGLSGYLVLPLLSEHVNPQWSVKHVIVSRIFSYIYVFGILNFWRGVWNITDHFVGTDLRWSLVCYAISKLILIALRSVSSCLSSPFIVTKDHRDDFYKTYTLCRSEVSVYISTDTGIPFNSAFTFV